MCTEMPKEKPDKLNRMKKFKTKRTRQGKKKREDQKEAWSNGKSMQKD